MEQYYGRLNFEKKVIIWSLISRAGAIKMSEVWRGAGGGGTSYLGSTAPLHSFSFCRWLMFYGGKLLVAGSGLHSS